MVKTESSEIPKMSHDVPTVSLPILYDSWRCYYDATKVLLIWNLEDNATTSLNRLNLSGWILLDCGRGLERSSTKEGSGSFLVAP